MKNKKILIAGGVVLLIISAVAGYFGQSIVTAQREWRDEKGFVPLTMPKLVAEDFGRQFNAMTAADKPERLPDVPFLDINGKETRIKNFAGKLTLINFWATWCAPCVVELPALNAFKKHYKDRLNVVGIALEEGRTPQDIKDFLAKRELTDFAGYVDQSGVMAPKLAGLRGLPTSYLIDRDGLILYRFEGDADWTGVEAKKFFDVILLQDR